MALAPGAEYLRGELPRYAPRKTNVCAASPPKNPGEFQLPRPRADSAIAGERCVQAEMRGQRVKKKLAIDPVEAEQVRLMFRLFLEGHDGSGPMGIKAIATWLNSHGYRTRYGACWGVGQTHHVLTNPVYAGRRRFNYTWSTAQAERSRKPSITSGEIPFRKAYLGAIVDRIEVDDRELRILGRKDVLQQAVIANAAGRNEVRSFVPRWLGD